MLRRWVRDDANKGCDEVHDREDEEREPEAAENTEVASDWWEEKELPDCGGYCKECEDYTNSSRVNAEATSKLQWKFDVRIVLRLRRVMHEDWQQLYLSAQVDEWSR